MRFPTLYTVASVVAIHCEKIDWRGRETATLRMVCHRGEITVYESEDSSPVEPGPGEAVAEVTVTPKCNPLEVAADLMRRIISTASGSQGS